MHYDFQDLACSNIYKFGLSLYKYLLFDLTRLPFHWTQIPDSAKYRKTNTNIEQNDKKQYKQYIIMRLMQIKPNSNIIKIKNFHAFRSNVQLW